MTFYNTTHLSGETLEKEHEQAVTQQDLIMKVFTDGCHHTPFDIMDRLGYPITSIRRAITNLTDAGKLEKTQLWKEGGYGKRNHTWVIKERQIKMEL